MIVPVAAGILGDVGVHQPHLAVFRPGVGILEVDPASPDRLDLGAGEDQASLKGILDMVIVIRLAVDGDYFFAHRLLYQKLMVMSSGGGTPNPPVLPKKDPSALPMMI